MKHECIEDCELCFEEGQRLSKLRESTFQFISKSVRIVDFISRVTNLKKRDNDTTSNNFVGVCYLCNNDNCEVLVSASSNIFYGTECRIGGDPILFACKLKGLSPLESLFYLTAEFDIQLPQEMREVVNIIKP